MRQHAYSKEEYIAALTKPVVSMGIEVGIAMLCWTLVEAFGASWPWWLHYSLLVLVLLVIFDGCFGRLSTPARGSVLLFSVTFSPIFFSALAFGLHRRFLPPELHFLVPLATLCLLIILSVLFYRRQKAMGEHDMIARDVVDNSTALPIGAEEKKNAANAHDDSTTAVTPRRGNQNGEIE